MNIERNKAVEIRRPEPRFFRKFKASFVSPPPSGLVESLGSPCVLPTRCAKLNCTEVPVDPQMEPLLRTIHSCHYEQRECTRNAPHHGQFLSH